MARDIFSARKGIQLTRQGAPPAPRALALVADRDIEISRAARGIYVGILFSILIWAGATIPLLASAAG